MPVSPSSPPGPAPIAGLRTHRTRRAYACGGPPWLVPDIVDATIDGTDRVARCKMGVSTFESSARLVPMAAIVWGADIAAVYDRTYATLFEPEVLDPMVDRLAELAGGGAALELAIGTGRVAIALHARGVPVAGIELSSHMATQLAAKPQAGDMPVTIGDMATTRVDASFRLVYLVANTIMNLTTQDEQLAVFANAAQHLEPGGCFVLEVVVPQLRRLPPGELGRVFRLHPDHVGIETFDDLVDQVTWSHHWIDVDGGLLKHSAPYRYVWPSELDLMAKLAGMRRRDRWGGWHGQPFTSDSTSQVVVYERPRS